jgi:hypothetical protein
MNRFKKNISQESGIGNNPVSHKAAHTTPDFSFNTMNYEQD